MRYYAALSAIILGLKELRDTRRTVDWSELNVLDDYQIILQALDFKDLAATGIAISMVAVLDKMKDRPPEEPRLG